MKLLCSVLLLFSFTVTKEAEKKFNENNKNEEICYVKQSRTNFQIAFDRIHKFEGYYSYHSKDKGGETYRGIARRFSRNWQGWPKIDQFKKEIKGYPRWNQRIESADFYVTDFYVSLWVKEDFYSIQDSTLAAYVFEFRIHGIKAIQIMEKQLNLPVDGVMDSMMIQKFNSINKNKFLKDLKKARISYYNNIVKRDSTQRIFLKHWLTRANI